MAILDIFILCDVKKKFDSKLLFFCPVLGVGYACQLIELYSCMCYIIILAWALLYLVLSFKFQLPWASCDNIWNTGINHMYKNQCPKPVVH